jgi:hypothetical protein
VLYIETKADIDPVYVDESFVKYRMKFMKPMEQAKKGN